MKTAAFLKLTKPGIVIGNAVNAIAGFLLGSGTHIDFGLLLATTVGLSLVIAAACVFNNYIDRDIDRQMKRTKRRALVTGEVSSLAALSFGTVLGLLGASLLAVYTNPLTLGVALFGLFAYVVLYGLAKRRTSWGTVVGSIPGATPPVVGYTAVSGHMDGGAWLIFLILIFWQMPHFYAIAIYRRQEYKAASLPVLPLVKGLKTTKIHIVIYQIAFLAAVASLTVFGYAGYTYLVLGLVAGLIWLRLGLRGFSAIDENRWARQLFGFSLIVTLVMALALSIGNILP